MENQRQKWVNLVFTGLGLLSAAVLFVALSKISVSLNFESKIKSIELVVRLASIILGAMIGFGLYFSDKTNAFMNEVILELTRVTWPSSRDTSNATIWVILFVLIAGAFLGALDSLWAWIIRLFL